MDHMHLPRYALPWAGPALGIFLALLFAWRVLGAGAQEPALAEFATAWGTVLVSLLAGVAALRARISPALACMLQAGALATASSALGVQPWHLVFKPVAMLCAMFAVAQHLSGGAAARGGWLLLAALTASLAGDVLLMQRDLFLPGLLAFLLAHLCYLALFRQGQRWFAHRGALWLLLLLAAALLAFLWRGGLPTPLRLPVAVYALALALMAAQAWGRWHQAGRGDRSASGLVALGACSFMLSEALLATHRFMQPLPAAQITALGTYYLAQALIVTGMLSALRHGSLRAGRS